MAELEFGVLGPLLVRSKGVALRVGQGKQRAILATLLLNAGRPVSVGELTESLWGSEAPPSAPVAIRNYVMRLRHSLGQPTACRIHTQLPGYLINVNSDEFDVARFEELLTASRVASQSASWTVAAEKAAAALAIWRGEPLADVDCDALARSEVPRLTELRMQAVEAWADASLRLGRHAEVVGELERLAASHPLREHLSALLMLGYYRDSRPAAALALYRHVRGVLVSELGMEPGAELRELQRQILAADAALSSPGYGRPSTGQAITAGGHAPAVPHQLPAGVRHFVGRVGELDRLSAFLDQAAQANAAVAIAAIAGTAGVGKTTLAAHWAHRVADRFSDGQLYVNLRGFGRGEPVEAGEAVRGFLDALGVPVQGIPVGLDAQAGLYRTLVSGKKMLVLLDNARDADQVRPLLPGGPGSLVLVTSRSQLTGLIAAEDAYPVSLDVLSQTEACELLTRRMSATKTAAQSAVIRELADLCAGLPLALSIVAAIATARPGLAPEALAAELTGGRSQLDTLDAGDGATSVRGIFSWSYQQLSEPAARMFRLLGIHQGPDISLAAAASIAGLPGPEARTVLAELRAANLVGEQQAGRFSFHDLLRAYAAELSGTFDSPQERRAATGRVLDHYLHAGRAAAAQYAPGLAPPLPALPPPAPGVALQSLEARGQALAWFEAEHKVLVAAITWAAEEFAGHAMRLPLTLWPFLDRGGYWDECVTTGTTALAAARRLGDTEGQACACFQLGRAFTSLGGCQKADAYLREALALYRQSGHCLGQGHAYIGLAQVCERQQRPAGALHYAEKALSQFRVAGDQRREASALNNVGWYHILAGNPLQALPLLREAIARQGNLGTSFDLAYSWDSLGYAQYLLGRHRQAIAHYRRAEKLCREFATPPLRAAILDRLGDAYRAAREPRAARQAWEQASDIFAQLNPSEGAGVRAKLADLADGRSGLSPTPGSQVSSYSGPAKA
jgi:DNA-binding SARP family transcriptional activator/tetratricopeptide (TPR) repeat protein